MLHITLEEMMGPRTRTHGFFEEFDSEVSAGVQEDWTVTATNSGDATVVDEIGGVIQISASDGSVVDNDETYLFRKFEVFKFVDEKTLVAEWRAQFAESDTSAANVIMGFMDAWAANSILDDGAGPSASYSGAVIFKEDGQTLLSVETSIAGAQTTTRTEITGGSAGFQSYQIICRSRSSTEIEVSFWCDVNGGQAFKQMRDENKKLIKHIAVLGTSTEMAFGFGAKNGSGNEDILSVDYAAAYQLR